MAWTFVNGSSVGEGAKPRQQGTAAGSAREAVQGADLTTPGVPRRFGAAGVTPSQLSTTSNGSLHFIAPGALTETPVNCSEEDTAVRGVCGEAFQSVLDDLRAGLRINFTADNTITYASLMLALQRSASSLCRGLLFQGTDELLLEYCLDQLTRIDAETSNLSLELDSLQVLEADLKCDGSLAAACRSGVGCNLCKSAVVIKFTEPLQRLLDGDVCSTVDGRDVNDDFACLFEEVLAAQSQISTFYLDITIGENNLEQAALNAKELYKEDFLLKSWIEKNGLICSMEVL